MAQFFSLLIKCCLNSSRHLLLNKFLFIAFPYFLETIKPSAGVFQLQYLKDKLLILRELVCFNMAGKSDCEIEKCNYAEICLRPRFLLRAKIARPFFEPILFLKPCLFFLLRFVYLTVTFIIVLF